MRDEYSFKERTFKGKFRLVFWLPLAFTLYIFKAESDLVKVISWVFDEKYGNYK